MDLLHFLIYMDSSHKLSSTFQISATSSIYDFLNPHQIVFITGVLITLVCWIRVHLGGSVGEGMIFEILFELSQQRGSVGYRTVVNYTSMDCNRVPSMLISSLVPGKFWRLTLTRNTNLLLTFGLLILVRRKSVDCFSIYCLIYKIIVIYNLHIITN